MTLTIVASWPPSPSETFLSPQRPPPLTLLMSQSHVPGVPAPWSPILGPACLPRRADTAYVCMRRVCIGIYRLTEQSMRAGADQRGILGWLEKKLAREPTLARREAPPPRPSRHALHQTDGSSRVRERAVRCEPIQSTNLIWCTVASAGGGMGWSCFLTSPYYMQPASAPSPCRLHPLHQVLGMEAIVDLVDAFCFGRSISKGQGSEASTENSKPKQRNKTLACHAAGNENRFSDIKFMN